MNISFNIEMIIVSIVSLIIIIFFLKHNSIALKYSIMWMLLPIVFILVVIFIDPLTQLAKWLGFEVLSNFIFAIIIGLLIMFCFALTIIISKQQKQIIKLIQDLSILKKENSDKKKK